MNIKWSSYLSRIILFSQLICKIYLVDLQEQETQVILSQQFLLILFASNKAIQANARDASVEIDGKHHYLVIEYHSSEGVGSNKDMHTEALKINIDSPDYFQ